METKNDIFKAEASNTEYTADASNLIQFPGYIKNPLTDIDLNKIVGTLEENAPDQVKYLRDIINSESSDISTSAEDIPMENKFLVANEDGTLSIDENYFDPMKETSQDILSIMDDTALNGELSENAKKAVLTSSYDKFGISDNEASDLLDVIMRYRNGENFNVYTALPEKMRMMVRNLGAEVGGGLNAADYNRLSKLILDEFISEADIDNLFIDIDKSIKEALSLPDISDLYIEHTKNVMTVNLIELADKVEAESPEKANTLRTISKTFEEVYKFSRMETHFLNNTRTRKLMRRDYKDYAKFCDDFNFKNEDSRFKMTDVHQMVPALIRILIDEDEVQGRFTVDDVSKFMVLWCRTCDACDQKEIIDATFMYYGIKIVSMLNLSSETKTDFSKEVIENLKNLILKIKAEEEKFYDSRIH